MIFSFEFLSLKYDSFLPWLGLNDTCRVKETPTASPNCWGAIMLHLVVHRTNETRGECKEECDKLSCGPGDRYRCKEEEKRGGYFWKDKSIN